MCGEHGLSGCGSIRLVGSSPHVRGTRVHEGGALFLDGIIPACAGNTDASIAGTRHARDHPRMCGEH